MTVPAAVGPPGDGRFAGVRSLGPVTRVLSRNWHGLHTVPATGLYPHQWSWDSAFIAIGLRHLSPRRAQQELESLTSSQWADGRLPQIVFDPARDDDYSPGASFWRSELIPGAPPVPTAGLIQPPNHAWAALLVHRADPDQSERRRFLPRLYPALVAWHHYLSTRRHTTDVGLAHILHPWESGMDNSPAWDPVLASVTAVREAAGASLPDIPRPDLQHAGTHERPSTTEYRNYLYLAARYRDGQCDDDRDPGFPFRVIDPAFNALHAASEWALAEIARLVGAAAAPHRARARAITAALQQLWDEELRIFVPRDAATRTPLRYATVSGLIPLLLPGLTQRDALLQTLLGPRFGVGDSVLVPSFDLTASEFDGARYWRGPSWFNTTWLIVEGLHQSGRPDLAGALARDAVDRALTGDFPEYLNPGTGDAHGTRLFSWTAALSLDLDVGLQHGDLGARLP